jgi:hypothetical protein
LVDHYIQQGAQVIDVEAIVEGKTVALRLPTTGVSRVTTSEPE